MGSTVNSTSAEIHSPTNQNFVYQGPTSAVFSYFFEPCLCFRFVVGFVFGSFPACVLSKPLKLNMTRTHTHVILFPFSISACQCAAFCFVLPFVFRFVFSDYCLVQSVYVGMPSSADAMFRLSVCFARFWDPPFRWLLVFYQNVLNMCFERNVSFSFSTLSRNKTNTTLRSDPAFCSAYTVQTCVRAMQDHSFGVCVCCGHAGWLIGRDPESTGLPGTRLRG